MSKKSDPKKDKTATTAPTLPKSKTAKNPAEKPKLKIRELTEEEADEVSGGLGGQAAFCA